MAAKVMHDVCPCNCSGDDAVLIERVADYFGGLAPGGCAVGAEVGAGGRGVAGLGRAAARVAVDYLAHGEKLGVGVERRTFQYVVVEAIAGEIAVESCRSGRDLYYLAPSNGRGGAEVGQIVGGNARLGGAAARIAAYVALIRQSLDEVVEG